MMDYIETKDWFTKLSEADQNAARLYMANATPRTLGGGMGAAALQKLAELKRTDAWNRMSPEQQDEATKNILGAQSVANSLGLPSKLFLAMFNDRLFFVEPDEHISDIMQKIPGIMAELQGLEGTPAGPAQLPKQPPGIDPQLWRLLYGYEVHARQRPQDREAMREEFIRQYGATYPNIEEYLSYVEGQ
jgi:hypothetical protein